MSLRKKSSKGERDLLGRRSPRPAHAPSAEVNVNAATHPRCDHRDERMRIDRIRQGSVGRVGVE
jgi:hypothetical protein